ncbi:uncharacterized protein PHACADRAFT_258394 [Phanerochaete carnosa HHB-10118-sp]|uniref:Allantoicase domain-containing protein n=1 Tax=Phanerochaete carnosa (strain HHB-10118-sp) TaxID=650164 RepID=K5UWS1_PHACS|nr:uncharacterized protein PHACADRAFT_258394 [Phanerochaete carnosa HHB-10118-sp]EKM54506.1 hypothetical protein PHACADRAFT_258394 [Phanerochaete carnosa HHB-10118-sp]
MPVEYKSVPLEDFSEHFSTTIELSSVALDGQVCSVSDEFFASAHHLLSVEPAPSLKGQFGPKGALYSGWESRRHNPTYDWCIIKLGCSGVVLGFDVDTSHFNGNEAPEVSVDAMYHHGSHPAEDDCRWQELLPRVRLGPNSRHLFKIPQSVRVSYVKLNMYPDGGIARFRVYGLVEPQFPSELGQVFDLALVCAGGRVVFTSDQHFGAGSNLILPGRGKDMGDGWETKRSREPNHKDWAIIKLGDAGLLSYIEIDTAHFMGNFPESCEVHAAYSADVVPQGFEEKDWTLVLPRTKLGPHGQPRFLLENVDRPYTHVKVTIYPDGGIKRVRVFGRRACARSRAGVAQAGEPLTTEHTAVALPTDDASPPSDASDTDHPPRVHTTTTTTTTVLPALPLSPEAFAPFGQVVQAYADVHAVPDPRSTRVTGANGGTAVKFHKLALLESAYPLGSGASTGISVYRCTTPVVRARGGGAWAVALLERHPATKQAFVPMGEAVGSNALEATPGKRYLVVVALNGEEDDKPDLRTMRAFVASAGQGIMYNTGIWHHPMAVLDGPMDFACVETQIGNGDPLDCEVVSLDGYAVEVPAA